MARFRRPSKRALVYFVASAVTVIAIVLGVFALTKNGIDTPSYATITPNGSPVSELGGWKRVSPSDSNPVFAYTDSIDGVSVSVSQQPLPSSFKDNQSSKVAELAKSYNASNKLDADGTSVYIGDSAKGPQSVIFTKNDLLVLIKSQQRVSNESWVRYIKSLN